MRIFEAMAEVMRDVDAIGKNQKNQQQGFKFRGIDDVYNAVHPILAKHGVFTAPTVLAERTEERQTKSGGSLIYRILTIKYTFYASDGSSFDTTVIGEGMDSGDKGANKAMAVAHKYALLQTLCIPTEDMIDPDSQVPEPSVPKQTTPKAKGFNVSEAWKVVLSRVGGDEAVAKGLFNQAGAETSKDITDAIFQKVMSNLDAELNNVPFGGK
jgi:hypothetical protein